MSTSLSDILSQFSSCSLRDIESTNLMERMDEKFFFHQSQLYSMLEGLIETAQILEIDGKRNFTYKSQYLDTDEFDSYLQHHNKRSNRYKLRYRSYLDTGLYFLEIKYKGPKGIMQKLRIEIDEEENDQSHEVQEYVNDHTPYDFDDLNRSLSVTYNRITLMNKDRTERLTIDQNLCFERKGKEALRFDNLTIVELKQKKKDPYSPFRQCLREHGIRSRSISKYCLGISSMYDHLKSNAFREQQRAVQKIESYA